MRFTFAWKALSPRRSMRAYGSVEKSSALSASLDGFFAVASSAASEQERSDA